jgi:hypothetical protein
MMTVMWLIVIMRAVQVKPTMHHDDWWHAWQGNDRQLQTTQHQAIHVDTSSEQGINSTDCFPRPSPDNCADSGPAYQSQGSNA